MEEKNKKKKIVPRRSIAGSTTDESAFPSIRTLGPGDPVVHGLNPECVSGLQVVPQIGKKACEGKVRFEGREVGYLWYYKKQKT